MIIVDDEHEVTAALFVMCNWKELGINEVITFNNSNEAYDFISHQKPDILITDIKMPKITGLELAEHTLKLYPETKVIVLSGYDEFKYAQTAMKLGVLDYQLKPFSFDEMLDSVKKAIAKINADNVKKKIQQYDNNINQYDLYFKKMFFLDLENECSKSAPDIYSKLKQLGIASPTSKCISFCIDIYLDSSSEIWKEQDIDLLRYAIENIVSEVYNTRGIVYYTSNYIVLLLFECTNEKSAIASLNECLNIIRNSLYIDCAVGTGSLCQNISELFSSFNISRERLAHMLFYEKTGINNHINVLNNYIYPKDLEISIIEKIGYDDEKNRKVKLEILDYLNSLNGNIKREHLLLTCNTLLYAIKKKLTDINIDTNININTYWVNKTETLKNISDLRSLMSETLDMFFREINKHKVSRKDIAVSLAVDYTNNNLCEDLSLVNLSRIVDLSPGYLAILLKEFLGMNFSEYVIKKRIELAKELLKTTEKKVGDIAKLCGYENQRYFSETFKTNVGCKPSEYRKKFIS